ncbi:peptidylprolyl isomerase [Frigidibacter sp. ROC022]|uniref:peptidylprolyl isomerase n=1 Tax=Frigidibacter sp. ROC022 TaxID=2971796 RepID=UPI00215A6AC9|nr:peptidylprolyl isomerase [Frigidibacter sp. ROC022]MCR8724428.1 peptidylprolyl isomerase [Frigidibacter sp. ROC022]
MSLITRTTAVVALALGLAAPVLADDALTADTVVATVNGHDITLGHMLALRADLPEQYQTLPDEVLFQGILDQVIQQTALSDMMTEPTRAEQLTIENQTRALNAGLVIQRLLKVDVSEEDLQAAYDKTYAGQEPETEYNASHILVKTEDEAKAIVEELRNGADFAAIAKEKSLDPGSGANGGELGWFGKGMMVPEFENAVTGLEIGAISDPVKTQFGWHVIKVNDTRVKEAPTLDEVRDELTAQIRDEAVQKAIAEATDKAEVVRSDIEIDPSVISQTDLLK